MRSSPMRKFCSERCVCAPQYLSAGTSIGPNVSVSVRVFAMIRPLSARHIITNARRFEDMSTEALELTPAIERRPPAPQPRVSALGPIGLYRALRANAITAWRVEAYEEPYLADRNMLGGYVLLNDPGPDPHRTGRESRELSEGCAAARKAHAGDRSRPADRRARLLAAAAAHGGAAVPAGECRRLSRLDGGVDRSDAGALGGSCPYRRGRRHRARDDRRSPTTSSRARSFPTRSRRRPR